MHGERFMVADHRHVHLRSVLKVETGRTLRVGLWDGPIGRAVVVRTDQQTELDVEWTDPRPQRPPVHLILAIPRPKSLKKLLPEVVALGVGRLTLLRSWRVAQPYLSSPMLSPSVQRPLITNGLMQAGCTRPPIVAIAPRFRSFIDDVAVRLPDDVKLVCHPSADHHLADHRVSAQTVAVAVGPEGGWLPYEVEAFEQVGFRSVRLGSRILRVETACVALLANLELLRQQQSQGS